MKKIFFLIFMLTGFAFAERSGTIKNFGKYSIKCPACPQKTTEEESNPNNTFFCYGCHADRHYELETGDNFHNAVYRCSHNHVIIVDLKNGNWKTYGIK